MYVSESTRREAFLEDQLARLPALTGRTRSPSSHRRGCREDDHDVRAREPARLAPEARVVAIDANPAFGTLAGLAPDDRRSDGSLAGLLAAMPPIASVAEVLPFVSRLPTGLHVLAAPDDPEAMAQITPAAYGELLAFLGQYYELIILDLGTGITDPLARFAVERSDQVVLVTTPEWITARLSRLGPATPTADRSLPMAVTTRPTPRTRAHRHRRLPRRPPRRRARRRQPIPPIPPRSIRRRLRSLTEHRCSSHGRPGWRFERSRGLWVGRACGFWVGRAC